jgi:hypothetical protein
MKKLIFIISLLSFAVVPHFIEAQKDSLKAMDLIINKWKIKKVDFDSSAKVNEEIKKSINTIVNFKKDGKITYENTPALAESWKLDWKNKRIMVYGFMDHPQYYKIEKLNKRKMILHLHNKKTGGFSVIYKVQRE